jgi:hypothetical protein
MAKLKGGTTISGYISLHGGNFNPTDFAGMQGVQGSQGTQGSQGPQGSQGAGNQGGTGARGPQGDVGVGNQGGTGVRGPQGSQGPATRGSQGSQGSQGSTGASLRGNQGSRGPQGDDGATFRGSQGSRGPQGDVGTSLRGNQGGQGPQGPQGTATRGSQGGQGPQGDVGATLRGSQGSQGGVGDTLRGDQGVQGYVGTGNQGGTGAQGPQGSGTTGGRGAQGPNGSQGPQGSTGYQGNQGSQGPQGSGTTGGRGAQGPQGSQGSQGNQGPRGYQGFQGYQGTAGPAGTGLEKINEGTVGWRLVGRSASTFGSIGADALDFSYSNTTSATLGALSTYGIVFGWENSTNSSGTNNVIAGGSDCLITSADRNCIIQSLTGVISGASTDDDNFIGAGYTPEIINGARSAIFSGNDSLINNSDFGFTGAGFVPLLSTGHYSAIVGGIHPRSYAYRNVVLGGSYLEAKDYCEIVAGRYNVLSTGSKTGWTSTDSLFVLGNGTGVGSRSNAFQVLKNGTVRAQGDIIGYTTSDKNLKDNITLIPDPIGKVKQLRGATWDWNDNADIVQKTLPNVGLIAQDVEKILPQLVHKRDNEQLALDYPKIVALLVEVGKEQQKQIQKLLKSLNKV